MGSGGFRSRVEQRNVQQAGSCSGSVSHLRDNVPGGALPFDPAKTEMRHSSLKHLENEIHASKTR